jgi:beta-glucanase (GH16 family)
VTQYHFFIGDEDTPEEMNQTGLFEYTFEETGVYNITVRAYGASGRYISKTTPVTIDGPQSDPIPLSRGYITPESYEGHELIWRDEFNGNSLGPDWVYEIGDGCPNCGWGNNELQYYRADNNWVADSVLTIEARLESFGGKEYTSTRIITKGNFSFQYGRVDIRALLPEGQGLWPALWTLGENISSVSWPDCGEIDIMEMIGGNNRENTVYGTAHWEFDGSHASYGQSKTLPASTYNFAEAYHVFSIVWDENTIKWYVDDVEYNEIDITAADMTEFHAPHFFIFNVAVGGNWPGAPNQSTIFPQQMKVDYIRVFQPE